MAAVIHVARFNQLQCFISAQLCNATLNFVNDMKSNSDKINWNYFRVQVSLEKEVEQLQQRVSELDEQNRELRSQLRSQLHSFEFEGEKALDKEIDATLNEIGIFEDFLRTKKPSLPNSFEMVRRKILFYYAGIAYDSLVITVCPDWAIFKNSRQQIYIPQGISFLDGDEQLYRPKWLNVVVMTYSILMQLM